MFPVAFGLATALAGLTGALITPILALEPHVGDSVLAKSFIVVILGGLATSTLLNLLLLPALYAKYGRPVRVQHS